MLIGVLSDTHGNRELMFAAVVFLQQMGAERFFHLGDDYSDFEELKFSGLEVYGVPGLWCREYNDWHIPNLIIEEIEGVTIAAAHSETSLNHKARAADIVLTGHTHHASMAEAGRAIYLNPGHLKNISSRGVYASFASIAIDGDKIRVTIHEMTGDPRQTEEFSLQTR